MASQALEKPVRVGSSFPSPHTQQAAVPHSAALPVPCTHMHMHIFPLQRQRERKKKSWWYPFCINSYFPWNFCLQQFPSSLRLAPSSSSALHTYLQLREEIVFPLYEPVIPSGPKKAPHWAQKKCSGCHVLSKAVTTFCSEEAEHNHVNHGFSLEVNKGALGGRTL